MGGCIVYDPKLMKYLFDDVNLIIESTDNITYYASWEQYHEVKKILELGIPRVKYNLPRRKRNGKRNYHTRSYH